MAATLRHFISVLLHGVSHFRVPGCCSIYIRQSPIVEFAETLYAPQKPPVAAAGTAAQADAG